MKILAVDASTNSASVAILDDLRVTAEWTFYSTQTHNRRLLKTVEYCLDELGLEIGDIDGFAATSGPGSFTGIRIGLTTVKTLAWSLEKPFTAVPSLDALAYPFCFSSSPICTLIDARKKEVYCALFQPEQGKALRLIAPHQALSPEDVPALIKEPAIFCGDGWLLYKDLIQKALGDLAIGAPSPFHTIRAGVVGEMARVKFLEGESEDPMRSVPFYVRPSEAELKKPTT